MKGAKPKRRGRPPTGHVYFQLKLRPETAALLREKLPDGLRSTYVDSVVFKALKNDSTLLNALKELKNHD